MNFDSYKKLVMAEEDAIRARVAANNALLGDAFAIWDTIPNDLRKRILTDIPSKIRLATSFVLLGMSSTEAMGFAYWLHHNAQILESMGFWA